LLKDQKSNTSERRARSNKLNRNNAPSMRAAYRRFFVGHVACHPQKLWPAAGEASAAACQRSATSPVSMEMQFPAHGTPNDFLLMQVFRCSLRYFTTTNPSCPLVASFGTQNSAFFNACSCHTFGVTDTVNI
jgi:hypothetical protein